MMDEIVAYSVEDGMIAGMAKKRTQPDDPLPAEDNQERKTTARPNFRYVGIPVDLYERLRRWAEKDERSINWAAKRIISNFLDELDLR